METLCLDLDGFAMSFSVSAVAERFDCVLRSGEEVEETGDDSGLVLVSVLSLGPVTGGVSVSVDGPVIVGVSVSVVSVASVSDCCVVLCNCVVGDVMSLVDCVGFVTDVFCWGSVALVSMVVEVGRDTASDVSVVSDVSMVGWSVEVPVWPAGVAGVCGAVDSSSPFTLWVGVPVG